MTSNARENSSMFGCEVCVPLAQFRSSGRVPKPRSGDRFVARGETAGYRYDCPENPGRGETRMSNTTLVSSLPGLSTSGANDAPRRIRTTSTRATATTIFVYSHNHRIKWQ